VQAATETASAAVNVTKTLCIPILQPHRLCGPHRTVDGRQRSRGGERKARPVPHAIQAVGSTIRTM
jgi:hypothetical protein